MTTTTLDSRRRSLCLMESYLGQNVTVIWGKRLGFDIIKWILVYVHLGKLKYFSSIYKYN